VTRASRLGQLQRPFQRLSIRLRITIGSLLIATLFFGIAVVAFRAQVQSILASTTTTVLAHDAAPSLAEIRATPPGPIDEPGRGQLVAVVDPNRVVVQSTLPKSLSKELDVLLSLDEKGENVVGGDDTYRVVTTRVETSAGTWHVIAARNEESAGLLLDRLTQALLVGTIVLIVGFGVASWLLTGASLRPVSRMREQAEAIVALRSTEPLPIGPAQDEISDLAATLNEFISDVRQSVDRERQLVSDASHELRSPLAILMTQLELAHLNSGDPIALEREITAAQRSVQRLSTLATSLLELSQLESGAHQGQSSWAELSAELARSIDLARLAAVAASVTIDFEIPSRGTVAKANSTTYSIATSNFARIISNLTANAVAAMPQGGSILVTMQESASNLVLSVADTGPGMPAEFVQIAFDRFSRPDDARARQDGGSGLGLAIVQAIVASAEGTISIANDAGLTVTISLPKKGLNRPVPV
jgi:two-component system, OmpR family, sensor kinase